MRARKLKTLAAITALLCAGAVGSARADTLYDALGGHEGLTKIIDYSVAAYVSDPRISAEFGNIDIDWFKKRLFSQFCQLAGGPCKYTGRDMHAAHKGLHLVSAQFNALVEDLQLAMDKAEIPFRAQNRLLALLAPMKRQIVSQ